MNKEVEQNTQDKLKQYVKYLNTLDKTFKGLSTEQDRTELNGDISEWIITQGNIEEFYLKSDINSFNCTYEYILSSTDEIKETLKELERGLPKEPEQEPKQEALSVIKPESLTGTLSQDKISEILVKAIGKDVNDTSIKSIIYHTLKQEDVDIVITEKLDDEFETEVLYRVNHETLIELIHKYLKDRGIDIVYTERHNKEEYHIWINEKENTISFRYNKTKGENNGN